MVKFSAIVLTILSLTAPTILVESHDGDVYSVRRGLSKSTKSPSSKSTKSPTATKSRDGGGPSPSASKSTKSPSSKSTKSPTSKSTKSPKSSSDEEKPLCSRGDTPLFNEVLDAGRPSADKPGEGGVIAGTGSVFDGGWTIGQSDSGDGKTIEVALRAKRRITGTDCRPANEFPNNGDGVYFDFINEQCVRDDGGSVSSTNWNWNFETSIDVDKGCDTAVSTCRTLDDETCSYMFRIDLDPSTKIDFFEIDPLMLPNDIGTTSSAQPSSFKTQGASPTNLATNLAISNIAQISWNPAFFGGLFAMFVPEREDCILNARGTGIFKICLETTCGGTTASTFINVLYGSLDDMDLPGTEAGCTAGQWESYETNRLCPPIETVSLFESEAECLEIVAQVTGDVFDGQEWTV